MLFDSNTYGSYILTKIAKLRFYPVFNETETEQERWESIKTVSKWSDRYHPKQFFGSFMIETTRPDLPKHAPAGEECQELYPYYLYVPLRDHNKQWYKNNPDSEFAQYLKKERGSKKILPISITAKQLEVWFRKTEEVGLLVEKYEG